MLERAAATSHVRGDHRFDPRYESPISLREACKLKFLHRDGKRPHLATLYRWATRGCRGIRLETLTIGGTMCTSEDALLRFIRRLSGHDAALPPSASRTRQRAIETAELEWENG